ncbi:MAG: LptF/LptG family permease [Lentisphaeria bacterium]|nr:LptF/LptG family permease [Lentisphaeria bacterium]
MSENPTTKRYLSKRLFFIVLKDFITYFVCCLVLVMAIFLVLDLVDDLGDFTGKKIPGLDILTYFVCKQAQNLIPVLPISLLLASMYCIYNYSKHNEIIAMRAMGISVTQACAPFISLALIIASLQFIFTQFLSPYTTEKADRIHQSVKNMKRSINHTIYLEPVKRKWFYNHIPGQPYSDVNLTQNAVSESKGIYHKWNIIADYAQYDTKKKLWIFQNLQYAEYESYDDFKYNEKKNYVFVKELAKKLPETPTTFQNYRLLNKMKAGIIIPIFQIDQVLKDQIIAQQIGNIHFLKKYYWYHLALPLSCIIAVLLAAPLSFSSQRSGVMLGILQSLVLMVVFICFREFFMTLNQIPPLLAGTVPTLIFLVLGLIGLTKKT